MHAAMIDAWLAGAAARGGERASVASCLVRRPWCVAGCRGGEQRRTRRTGCFVPEQPASDVNRLPTGWEGLTMHAWRVASQPS